MDDVVNAIADPMRREIMLLLSGTSMTAGDIAGRFTVSRPAVSRHLRVLRECGLVRDTSDGRHRVYELDASRLTEITDWIDRFADSAERPGRSPEWEHRLDALGTEVHRTRRDRRHDRESRPEPGREHRPTGRDDEGKPA